MGATSWSVVGSEPATGGLPRHRVPLCVSEPKEGIRASSQPGCTQVQSLSWGDTANHFNCLIAPPFNEECIWYMCNVALSRSSTPGKAVLAPPHSLPSQLVTFHQLFPSHHQQSPNSLPSQLVPFHQPFLSSHRARANSLPSYLVPFHQLFP